MNHVITSGDVLIALGVIGGLVAICGVAYWFLWLLAMGMKD